MSRYQRLKEHEHKQVCEWMRCLGWKENCTADQLASCAYSFFKNRHRSVPLYKRARKPSSRLKMTTRPRENRLMAINLLARREIIESANLFPPAFP